MREDVEGTLSNHQTAANSRKLQRFVLVLKVLLTPVYNYQKPCSLEFYGCSGPNREPDFFQLIVPKCSQLANPSIQELPTMMEGVSKPRT